VYAFLLFARALRGPHIYYRLDQRSSTSHHSLIVSLHPLLSYGPNLRFNVTRDISEVQLRPGCPPTMLLEPAVQPQVSHMTINIYGVPASTTEVINPRGVTVNDVLVKIREMLYRNVSSHEMHRSSRAVSVIDSFRLSLALTRANMYRAL
jgi:hypothetical protein